MRRPWLSILALALLSVATCHARLGDTVARLEKRYGERTGGSVDGNVRYYKAGPFGIRATITNDVCTEVVYWRSQGKLTKSDYEAILKANGGGFTLDLDYLKDTTKTVWKRNSDGARCVATPSEIKLTAAPSPAKGTATDKPKAGDYDGL